MTRYVALLRGVNVGGITVRSADLAAMARDLGLDDVRTVLASGNLLFTSDDTTRSLKARIEKGLRDSFGYDAWIVLTTAEHVAAVVDAYPFEEGDDRQPYVVYGSKPAVLKEIVEAASGLDQPPRGEQVAAGDGVVYWDCPKGSTLDTPFAKVIGKAKYRSTTTNRNLRTLRKLV
ncbi:MAG: DUF1697 domain-containing protein [Acidimicrobiales bacterium]